MSVRLRAPLAPALLAAAAVAILSAAFALASTGVYYDDDLAHYVIARFAWRHPELFLNTGGRPAIAAGQWLAASPYGARFTLGSHIWQQYAAGLDPYDPARFRGITPAEVEAAPPGTVIVWDSHYAHRLVWNTPLALLQDPRRFRLLKAWEQPTFQLYIFEKTAP